MTIPKYKVVTGALSLSEAIRGRIGQTGKRFFSNDNISEFITEDEIPLLVNEVAARMEAVLQALVIDTANDHNAQDTARRYAKMLVTETFNGRYVPQPKVTVFPNVEKVDELYTVGPINMRSTCSHHHVAITGSIWVSVLPGEKLIGLSKFHRIADHIASRPQIQEEMTKQLADVLETLTEPLGIAVMVLGNHLCCGHRGVKDQGSRMVTTVLRGEFRTNESLKSEFLKQVDLTRG